MRLLDASSLQLETYSSRKTAPPYAILSHTWGNDDDEVSFQDMQPGFRSHAEKKLGFEKVKMICALALQKNINYVWIDTCCIDKSSSAELSESINSMFKWYQRAVCCFAWLADWEPDETTFAHCKWFTRGWTLQELVASEIVVFYDKSWQDRGSKLSLSSELSRVSGITESVLDGTTELADVPIAVRMSWAAHRSTTREEDIAYSLLGIFDINMPMLYGEGDKAFQRLQEEIIKSSEDMSIFAWRALPDARQSYTGMLASSPQEFKEISTVCHANTPIVVDPEIKFFVSNRGLELQALLELHVSTGCFILPVLHYDLLYEPEMNEPPRSYGVFLRRVGLDTFVRELPDRLAQCDTEEGNYEKCSVRVFRRISAQASNNISRRELHIRHPVNLVYPNLGLVTMDQIDVSDSPWRKLVADHSYEYGSLHHFVFDVKSSRGRRFSPFTLLCYFQNSRKDPLSAGYWKCGLVKGVDDGQGSFRWIDVPSKLDAVTSRDDQPSPCTTTLGVPGDESYPTVKVALTLERKISAKTLDEQFYIDLRVENTYGNGNLQLPYEGGFKRPAFLGYFTVSRH
jgi:hypothetical protein